MAEEATTTTEQTILEAARQQFHQKGFAGARMQEIADKAEINKAMLHYYYRSKQQLFEAVFQEDYQSLVPIIIQVLNGEKPLFQKIREFADQYISFIQNHPYLPGFIMNELSQNPDRIVNMTVNKQFFHLDNFFQEIRSEADQGNIRPIDPKQLMVHLVSLCIFPFVGKPMLKTVLQMDEPGFQEFIETRKTEVPEFVISSIQKNH